MSKLEQAARQALEAIGDCSPNKALVNAAYALREALAEPELNLNCKSVQKRLATVWGYVKAEQTEQSQLADASLEPVAYLCPSFVDNFATGRYETCEQKDYGAFPVYTHPVRTKDLTDEEIMACRSSDPAGGSWLDSARAVIAKFKEKNK